jgi:subfamily B ATP-binding cassette protein HlyB/CyaB
VEAGLAQAPVVENSIGSGLMSLRFAVRYLGVFVDPEEFHRLSVSCGASDTKEGVICAARTLGLTIRLITTDWDGLKETPLPAIACLKDGSFLAVARYTDGKMLLQHPTQGRPQLLGPAEFNSIWNGELILVRRRTRAAQLARILGLSWFG